MRLLKLKDDGEFSLTEFIGNEIPRYAILSHTWGVDSEEVTFKDLMEGTGKSKAGKQKIRFCGKQAAADSLQYFWIDACCIDKSSSAELSEAINSMFRWYRDAAKCYVYLSDVSISGSIKNYQFSQWTWESAFRESRWFTRGWTLQELIAPASIEFFSVEGERLGDKKSLERQIHKITGIATQALQGGPLSQFSVNERMLWAAKRKTKREEDVAYSLMGIFDIHMPLIYGEGREKALVRLHKEIEETLEDKLPARHVEDLEAKLTALEKNFTNVAEENERLKLQLQRVATENEILKATSGHPHHGVSESLPNAGLVRYSPTDFYTEVLHAHENKAQSHRIVISESGERLLAAGATWDYIIKHPLYARGLVDVGDISDTLKKVAKSDGQGPVFEESAIIDAIEKSVMGKSDELI